MTRRTITDFIVVHCSATRPDQHVTANTIREWHMAKGWSDIGYHFVIRRDGVVEPGRALDAVGAHVAGYNSRSVGICLVGGLDSDGKAVAQAHYPAAQIEAARDVVRFLRRLYPEARVLGHRDLSPDRNMDGRITPDEWVKTCPGLSAAEVFS